MLAFDSISARRVLLFALATILLHLGVLHWFGQYWLRPASAHGPARAHSVQVALQSQGHSAPLARPAPLAQPAPPPPQARAPVRPARPPHASAQVAADAPATPTLLTRAALDSRGDDSASAPPQSEPPAPAPSLPSLPAPPALSTAGAMAVAAAPASPTPVSPPASAAPTGSGPANPSGYRVLPLPSVEIKYAVQKIDGSGETPNDNSPRTRGRGSIRWLNQGQQYRLVGEFKFLFFTFFSFQSEGELDAQGIAPLLYSEKRGTRSPTNTHFQRQSNLISFSATTKQYPRSPGAQDWASVVWQLAGIGLADSEKFHDQAELEIVVAGPREATPWRFQVQGLEHLTLDQLELDAWHLARIPLAGSHERRLDIWLSPQHQFAPARILQTDPNGSQIEMKMTEFTLLPPTTP